MTALLNFVPILLAILAAVGAFLCKSDSGVHDFLLMAAGALFTSVLPALRVGSLIGRGSEETKLGPPAPDKPVVP